MLERILGNASKTDKLINERKRARLTELFESIQNIHSEVMAELEMLRKDDAKVKNVLASRQEMYVLYRNKQLCRVICLQPNRRYFRVWNSHGQHGHVTMAIPGAAFSAVRFCGYTVRRAQCDRLTVMLISRMCCIAGLVLG